MFYIKSAISDDMNINECRICNNKDLKKILSLGTQPLANSFLTKEDLEKEEKTFPLEMSSCPSCKLLQLTYVVPPEIMFKNYVYVSSTTDTFKIHFFELAEELTQMLGLNKESLAVDIGSNDGVLLKGFQSFGVRTVGVEPATNVAKIAEQNGVETINDFFNGKIVGKIIKEKGHADVVTAANVFAHVNDIHDFVKNVKLLLKENGIFVIEVPYLLDMLEKMTFDTIYHEHLSYFTVTPLVKFFNKFGMGIFKIKKVDSHGGSLRIFVKNQSVKFYIDESVNRFLENEKKIGVGDSALYENFAQRVLDVKSTLLNFLQKIKDEGKSIAAYGAPAKGNTLLNFCGIGQKHIDYVIDDNPLKQDLFTPGTHIPVVDSSILDKNRPDFVLILAWNFAEEILAKNKKYRDEGVKFIIPLPEPVIV